MNNLHEASLDKLFHNQNCLLVVRPKTIIHQQLAILAIVNYVSSGRQDRAHYGVSRAEDWVSLDCGTNSFGVPLSEDRYDCIFIF